MREGEAVFAINSQSTRRTDKKKKKKKRGLFCEGEERKSRVKEASQDKPI